MNNKMLEDLLASQNATCLLPLLQTIGNLDDLVKQGPEAFVRQIPMDVKIQDNKLNDIRHFLEASYEEMSTEQLANYSIDTGKICRARRIRKTELVFLNKPNATNLVESFIQLIELSRQAVNISEADVYLARNLKPVVESPRVVTKDTPSESIEKIPYLKPEILGGPVTKRTCSDTLGGPVVKRTDAELFEEAVNNIEEEKPAFVQYNSDRDSLSVKDGIEQYKLKYIYKDMDFNTNLLCDKWCDKFNNCTAEYKKDMLQECYNEFWSLEISNEKKVSDYAVWNYILPKKLHATGKYSK